MKKYFGLIFIIVFLALAGYLSFPHEALAAPCPPGRDEFIDRCESEDPPITQPESPNITEKSVTTGLSSDGRNGTTSALFVFTFSGNAGQVYQINSQILQNDDPAPGIEFCVNNSSVWGQGHCRTVQQAEGGNSGDFREFPITGLDSLDYTHYSHLVVRLSVRQEFFNENDVKVRWTMFRREFISLDSATNNTPTILAGASPEFSWQTSGSVPDRKIFMEGPGGITGFWDTSVVPAETNGWTLPMSLTTPGTYNFTLEVAGPARMGGEAKRTWDTSVLVTSPATLPGPFSILGINCFDWPNPKAEIVIDTSEGAVTYSVQRRQGSGGWATIVSNLTYTQLDQFADNLAQNQTYEYRVIATNPSGDTFSSNTAFVTTSEANCGSSAPPPPPPGGGLSCSPGNQTVQINTNASFSVSGGTSYTWSAPGGSPSSGTGSSFSTSYSSLGNKTVTVTSGALSGNCNVSVVSSTTPIPCVDNAQVNVSSPLPATVSPGQVLTTTYNVINTGNDRWYHGDAYRFVQTGSSLPISDINTTLNYGHLPYGMYPGDNVSWTFNVTAPTTPGTYQLNLRMMHRAGWNYLRLPPDCPNPTGPAADTFFGNSAVQTFTIAAAPPSSMSFSIVYTPKTLLPAASAASTLTCPGSTPTVNLSWTYASNGAEDGFNIYRSPDSTNWTLVKTVGAAVRATTDAPTPNQRHYYWIRAHRALNINPRESNDPANGDKTDIFVGSCTANLTSSNKVLSLVNDVAYNQATTSIKSGDKLTFTITISNVGNTSATVNYICDDPSDNLSNLRNLNVSGAGASGSTITASDGTCIANGHEGPRLNVTGNLATPGSWTITFDSTFTASTATETELACNSATIYYTDAIANTQEVNATCALGRLNSGVPTFREVAP